MAVMKSDVSAGSDEFRRNRAAYDGRIADLHARRAAAMLGGPERARRLHKERKQLLPRERISALLDPGSPFLEFCQLAGEGMYDGVPPGGSIVTGVGMVSGRACMIIANDATVKGGTYYGITCKKHVRAQRFAWQHRLPCVTMVQSGGANLPDQPNIFPDEGQFGSIFYNQIRMSSEGIAADRHRARAIDRRRRLHAGAVRRDRDRSQSGRDVPRAVRNWSMPRPRRKSTWRRSAAARCTAASAASPIIWPKATATPSRSRATSSPISAIFRRSAGTWRRHASRASIPADIYGLISADPRIPTNNREIIARLVDGSEFHEFKPLYGDTLITGFARIMGFEVGILCNNGVLFSECALKATHFIDLCCKRNIPLLFMADVTGFMVGREAEEGGIAKHGAKMITAMASANVPKYTLIIGNAYGAGYLAMCGRAFKPNAMMMWPNGRSAIMGPDQAANTLAMVRDEAHKRDGTNWTDEEREAYRAPVRKTFEDFANAYNFARHTWCDMVIDPLETRNVMALLLDLAGRLPPQETEFGVFRM